MAAGRALETIRRGADMLESFPFTCREVDPDDRFLQEPVVPFGNTGYVALVEMEDERTATTLAVRPQCEDDYHLVWRLWLLRNVEGGHPANLDASLPGANQRKSCSLLVACWSTKNHTQLTVQSPRVRIDRSFLCQTSGLSSKYCMDIQVLQDAMERWVRKQNEHDRKVLACLHEGRGRSAGGGRASRRKYCGGGERHPRQCTLF